MVCSSRAFFQQQVSRQEYNDGEMVARFASSPCSHHGRDASTIVSFSWSDFPIIGDGRSFLPRTSTSSFEETSWDPSCCSKAAAVASSSDCCSDETSSTASIDSLVSDLEDSATAAASSSTHSRAEKRVRFSPFMEVRTHQVVLGDHPFCVGGMALELGWRHAATELLDLDIYEELHAPGRRHFADLRLDYAQRRERLEANMGLTGAELLRLEYDLICCNNSYNIHNNSYQQVHTPPTSLCTALPLGNSSSLGYTSFTWKPLHHAGSFPNSLEHLVQCHHHYTTTQIPPSYHTLVRGHHQQNDSQATTLLLCNTRTSATPCTMQHTTETAVECN